MDPRGTWHMAHCGDLPLSRPFLPCCGVEWYRVEWLQKFDACVFNKRREQERSQREPIPGDIHDELDIGNEAIRGTIMYTNTLLLTVCVGIL